MTINPSSALIIDVASKQQYIFTSNKLKLNIGASHIISNVILGSLLDSSLKELSSKQFEKVNVGGGNAILYFDTQSTLRAFLSQYSEQVLRHYPGILLECGMTDISPEDSFKEIRFRLNKDKNERRSNIFYSTEVNLGIAKECPYTGKPQNTKYSKELINQEASTKYDAAVKAQEKVNGEYKELLKSKNLIFSAVGAEIAPESEKGFLAVVHIDGNKIGQLFQDIDFYPDFKVTSAWLKSKLSHCLRRIIEDIVDLVTADGHIKDMHGDLDIKLHKISDKNSPDNGKLVLPLRSIINAGDDITFIAHGKLGIYLAERYMAYLAEEYEYQVDNQMALSKPGITACAGVAITHINHPFYKSYKMAESLCQNAKKASRKDDQPRLQYMIFKNGISGSLDDIWRNEYTSGTYKFKRTPLLIGSNSDDESHFNKCVALSKTIAYGEHKWPKNKFHRIIKSIDVEQPEFEFMLHDLKSEKGPDYFELLKNVRRSDLLEASELIQFYPILSK